MRTFKDYMAIPKEERFYMDWGMMCRHVSGLDVKEGARVRVKVEEDRFLMKARGCEIAVPKSEIKRVSIKTEEWVEVHVPQFSNIRALIGLASVGPLGIILGWPMGKTHEIERENTYLVIEKVDCSSFVFLCDKPITEIGDKQTPKKIVADFERGVGYAK